jgi:undecaprenyl-diphosphatase
MKAAPESSPPDWSEREHRAHHARWLRAWQFELALLVMTVLAGALAVLARTVGYFAIDIQITWALQSIDAPWLATLLHAVSWTGFPPQVDVLAGILIVCLFLVGLRVEAGTILLLGLGGAALWYSISTFVDRPRPSPELVHVATQINAGSFPSGHVLNLTAASGFLMYLTVLRVTDRRWRWLLTVLLAAPVLAMGVARVYDGEHWPSDVLGGYLIGGIWLALAIRIYNSARRKTGAAEPDPTDDAGHGGPRRASASSRKS